MLTALVRAQSLLKEWMSESMNGDESKGIGGWTGRCTATKVPPISTCQVGQSIKWHLLVVIQKHLDLPHTNPQVRFIEFIRNIPTCISQRRRRRFRLRLLISTQT